MNEHIDAVIAALDKINSGEALVTVGVAIEFIMRMLKTEKPRSIIYLVAGICHKVAVGTEKIAVMLDKVLPQRIKEEPKE